MFVVVPVAVQSGGTQKACRQEMIRDCVTFRDPGFGRAITLSDVEQFCTGGRQAADPSSLRVC